MDTTQRVRWMPHKPNIGGVTSLESRMLSNWPVRFGKRRRVNVPQGNALAALYVTISLAR